jgi:biopolymer transport protein ExbD
MEFEVPRHRHDPVQPQLTAMIDVCALLIIFLIAGSVFGASSLVLPSNITLPRSYIQEAIFAAPQVSILPTGMVKVSFSSDQYPVAAFRGGTMADPRLEPLRTEISAFLSSIETGIRAGTIINVIADKRTPYYIVYDVVQVFRKNGFQSVLFISEMEGGASK